MCVCLCVLSSLLRVKWGICFFRVCCRVDEESTCNTGDIGDMGSILGMGRSPGGGNVPPPTAPQNRSFLDVSLSLTPQAHSHLHSITKPCPLYLESVCVSPHPLPLSYSKPPASPSPTVWPPHLGHLCPSKPFSTQKPE